MRLKIEGIICTIIHFTTQSIWAKNQTHAAKLFNGKIAIDSLKVLMKYLSNQVKLLYSVQYNSFKLFNLSACLRDIVGLVPDLCNKENIAIKQVILSLFPMHIKVRFILYCTQLSVQ